MSDLVFLWPGFPDYAARLVRRVIEGGRQVQVIATAPSVPIEGMERSLGQKVYWIAPDAEVSFANFGLESPRTLFQGGYHIPAFNALGRETRRAEGRIILMADNNWTNSLRQRVIDPLRHRLLFTRDFDGVLVPGASGVMWARKMGYTGPVKTGMYGADPSLFRPGPRLAQRPKRLFFVGQFVERKNVLGLAKAFATVADSFKDWKLILCGSGEQRGAIPDHPQIIIEGFVQPEQLSAKLREARALVLPSCEEHWGMVVHEAALSGAALVLSSAIGAAEDLATSDNSVIFPPGDTRALAAALAEVMSWDDARLATAERVSLERARAFSPARFAAAVAELDAF
jgi:glycosyltransferase involved in cell wall biosynthesis